MKSRENENIYGITVVKIDFFINSTRNTYKNLKFETNIHVIVLVLSRLGIISKIF